MDTRRYQDVDVRAMLLDLGVGRYVADMAIPKTWFLVGTTDPDDATVIEIVKGIQRGLQDLGFKRVLESGVVDQETAAALDKVSGPSWVQRSWIQLMSDVLNGLHNPQQKALEMRMDRSSRGGLGSFFIYDGPPVGPLPGTRPDGVIVTPPGPLGMGATATDSGITLTYGKGISNPNNMVPVDAVTEAAFKNVQRQLNRNLAPLGRRVSEDGVIGTSTRQGVISLKGRLQKHQVAIPAFSVTTETMAYKAPSLGQMLKAEADARGIAANANMGGVSRAADTTAGPMSAAQGSASGIIGMARGFMPWLLLAGGVTAGAVYWRRKKGR